MRLTVMGRNDRILDGAAVHRLLHFHCASYFINPMDVSIAGPVRLMENRDNSERSRDSAQVVLLTVTLSETQMWLANYSYYYSSSYVLD